MQAFQVSNALPAALVESLLSYYQGVGAYRSSTMRKADPGPAIAMVEAFVKQHVDIDSCVGGNFYSHSIPYFPHTDHQPQWGTCSINVVFPLQYEVATPHLVVFDQQWLGSPMTWTLDYPVTPGIISSSVNEQKEMLPGKDPNVLGKTGLHIDPAFAAQHLPRDSNCYFGLSGKAFPFEPGSMIVFDNTHIHCTGKYTGMKTGLSLRYTLKEKQ